MILQNSLQRIGKANNYHTREAERKKFQVLDANGNNLVTMDEWMTFVTGLGMRVNEQTLRREFNSMNTDGNCCLDYNEMLPHLKRKHNLRTVQSAARLVDRVSCVIKMVFSKHVQ